MMNNPQLKLRSLWLLVGYAILTVIVYLSVTSAPVDVDLDFPLKDKVFHTLAYFVLMFWFVQIYHRQKQMLLFAAAFICVGLLMEYVQSFDPARYAELGDMVANSLGVILAVILAKTSLKNLLARFEALLF